MAGSDAFARITRDVLKIVAAIPKGRVTTFQSIGDCIDVPARHVAYALSRVGANAENAKIPLHRALGADGKVSTKPSDAAHRLAAEQINVANGRIVNFEHKFIDAAALEIAPEARHRPAQYAGSQDDIALSEMPGIGPATLRTLVSAGIVTAAELRARDPFELYAQLKATDARASINLLYALIGAVENRDWKTVAHEDKTRILMRLDDLGLAPK
jgi:DNA transformation protein and related proteins